MNKQLLDKLLVGGHKNTTGLVNEIVESILDDRSQLNDLFECVYNEDAWVRMRAIDAFEKICRQHLDWITPYINRIQQDLATSTQASIQWHIAEIYIQVDLTPKQKQNATAWLKQKLQTTEIDWIVAANCMKALTHFVRTEDVDKSEFVALLQVQRNHTSNAVIKKANKLLKEYS